MKKTLLIAHTTAEITTTTLFLFQMATLVANIRAYFGERTVSSKGRRRTCGEQLRRRRRRGPGMRGARRMSPGF
jgi:hypothetical protein